ncbi:MAG: hypothetical protein E7615_04085 [Ruminococcaceae bacterium]|nr:hypothetical protein [Oscillospiraceae bacterium]
MKKLNTKYLKTGGYAVLMSLVVLAIVIFVNVFINKLPATQTKLDLSSTDMYSISEKTIKLIDGLEKDVAIYYVVEEGSEDPSYTTMLGKYDGLSMRVSVKNVDPAKNPNFFKEEGRNGASAGSVIVECGDRSKTFDYFDVYYPGIPFDTIYNYYYSYGQMPPAQGFDLENQLTSAISFVLSEVSPVVYSIGGHGELPLDDTYKGYLESQAIVLHENFNLATEGAIPEDADCILLCAPETDISEQEKEILLSYLKNGGRMMYYSYYEYTGVENYKNLSEVLDYYGVSATDGIIYEGDSSYHLKDFPAMMLAQYGEHEIVTPFNGFTMILGLCQGINTSEDLRESVEVTPLLYTTDKAFSRVEESDSAEKIESDIAGPFDYAVAITETVDDTKETRIVWINTPIVLMSDYDVYGNYETLFLNSFGWLCDAEDVITVPTRELASGTLEINEAQSKILLAVFAVIIPVIFVGLGAGIWFRRRSK